MRAASAGMITTIGSDAPTLTMCAQVIRRDGAIKAFTSFNRDLTIDIGDGNGDLVYEAAFGVSRSNVRSEAKLNVDGGDIEGPLATVTSDGITEEDLRAGRYDFADIRWFIVDWADLSNGIIRLPGDKIGRVTLERGLYRAEVRGIMQRLQTPLGQLYRPTCGNDLGQTLLCGVRLDPPVWSDATAVTVRPALDAALGSVVKPVLYNGRHFKCVTAGTTGGVEPTWDTTLGNQTADNGVQWEAIQALTVTDAVVATIADQRRVFTLTTLSDGPDDLFTLGRAIFTSGDNDGLGGEVKAWDLASKQIELSLPVPFDIDVGNAVTLTAGCTKLLPACRDTYDNTHNRQAHDYIPGNDKLFDYPDAA